MKPFETLKWIVFILFIIAVSLCFQLWLIDQVVQHKKEHKYKFTKLAEMENNRGTLFKNEKKVEGDNKPYLSGKINVEGKDYDIAVWYYPAKGTKKAFFPVQLSEPYIKPDASSNTLNVDNDLPF